MPDPIDTPARFRPSKAVLFVDSVMTYFVKAGGVLVITAVLGIFAFIFFQIYPLFKKASLQEMRAVAVGETDYKILGMDEWGALPFLVGEGGVVRFVDLAGDGQIVEKKVPFDSEKNITAISWLPEKSELVFGSEDGFFCVVAVKYTRDFSGGNKVVASLKAGPWIAIGPEGSRVEAIAYNEGSEGKLAAAILFSPENGGKKEVRAVTLRQKKTLMGAGKLEAGIPFDLTEKAVKNPDRILVNKGADSVVVASREGEVDYFYFSDGALGLRQRFHPFEGAKDPRIATLNYLLGGVSLVATNPEGLNSIWSLYVPEGGNSRVFGKTKTFPPMGGNPGAYANSLRNKEFLLAAGDHLSLRYGTTEAVRWDGKLPYKVKLAGISGKNDRILLLDTEGKLHVFSLDDPHPETSFHALFGKIWYEGQNAPGYDWQSTGGSDDFEPKLSLVPLIVGTLKGTIYALVFAVPIALMAAIYTSQFLDPRARRLVKPTMEIMASLPSVVLGFLAALWLAPILETRVPSLFCIAVLVPVTAALVGYALSMLPMSVRQYLRPGYEFLIFVPLFLLVSWGGWELGPQIEKLFFVVSDPATGGQIADFRRWWPLVTGTPFEQRNSLVVGFMMGFAVIPIIFTIAEDAMSNVPVALRSGSLALGASRWQTARYVVLPTAAAGIFSALMIGLGRAVGETMIVVMATGNTPIMDMNIFSGMRTLSANIAVELPEAPHHSTLYRTLFLGAMMLFLLTFAVNTAAEVLRQHLREKFKTI